MKFLRLATILLVAFTLITPVSSAYAQSTPTKVLITPTMLMKAINENGGLSTHAPVVEVFLDTNQMRLDLLVNPPSGVFRDITYWTPTIVGGQLQWKLAKYDTSMDPSIAKIVHDGYQLKVLFRAFDVLLKSQGYASSAYSITSVSMVPIQGITISLVKKSSPSKAVNIPVAGTDSTDDDVINATLSQNWAGYVVTPDTQAKRRQRTGDVTEVSAQWTIPAVNCTKADTNSSIWIGIDGYGDPTVEQIGTSQDCVNGQPSYSAWFEVYPRPSREGGTITVSAGDVISANVKYTGNDTFVLTLMDVTTNKQFSITRSVPVARRRTAEWIMEAPVSQGKILPLANFDSVLFSAASVTIAGHTGSISDTAWQNHMLTMAVDADTVKAQPLILSTDGASFGVVWESSN